MKKKNLLYILLLALLPSAMSCNEDDDNDDNNDKVVYVSAANTAVTGFSLMADTICANLNAVYFTIDLLGKQVFNADSLPVGTDTRKLRVEITYPTTASKVELLINGGKLQDNKVINYLDSPYDSIDFTGKVILKIVAQNGTDSTLYDLKVNVHKVNPDSLYWDKLALKTLPVEGKPISQKTIEFGGKVYNLTQTADAYSLATIENPFYNDWQRESVNFGFVPKIETFVASNAAFYILSTDGTLYTSTDALSWSVAPKATKKYTNLYGGYKDGVLAQTLEGEIDYRANYYTPTAGDTDLGYVGTKMPVSGFSQLVTYDSETALNPQVIMAGGVAFDGSYADGCWGFDGSKWAQISAETLPAIYGPTLVRYKTVHVSSNWLTKEYNILMMFAGKDINDKASDRVFYSYDNGVYWKEATSLMKLPDYFPPTVSAQAVVVDMKYTRGVADETEGWASMSSRELPVWCFPYPLYDASTRAGFTISWDCPYIYLFGGYNLNGELNNTIWRGVLNRLSFKPIL